MSLVTDAAFALGRNVTRMTRDADVRELIQRLRPVDCGVKLIRIGGDGDGGYLLPDDLEGIEYCFSPGVGPVAEFENHLASLGIRSFLADYSVDSPPGNRPEFTFDKKFLGANDTETSLTIQSWRNKYLGNYAGDLLLQMDIEGAEYEAILSTPVDVLNGFRIIVVEFHFLEKIFDRFVFRLYKACFERMLSNFHVVHIHPNNCCGSVKKNDLEVPRVMEFTFYNKKRVAEASARRDFPHVLDRDNNAGRGVLALPGCWYE